MQRHTPRLHPPDRWWEMSGCGAVFHVDGDVVVLTSPITASAVEVFALAMVEVADVTIAGNPSFGEVSDAIDWVLPNDVEFTLSMEV